MQFLVEVLAGKTGAVSMTVMSRVRSSIDDPGKNRSYAKVSKYTARIGDLIKGQSSKIFMPRLDNCRWRTIFYQARSVASAMRAQRNDRQDG
jgi:hypothetical protein